MKKREKSMWITLILLVFSIFCFVFSTTVMHVLLNSSGDTFYFFGIPLSRALVFDIILVIEGLSFFIPTALLIYGLLRDKTSITVLSGILFAAFLLILLLLLNFRM